MYQALGGLLAAQVEPARNVVIGLQVACGLTHLPSVQGRHRRQGCSPATSQMITLCWQEVLGSSQVRDICTQQGCQLVSDLGSGERASAA